MNKKIWSAVFITVLILIMAVIGNLVIFWVESNHLNSIISSDPDFFYEMFYNLDVSVDWDLVNFQINDISTWRPLSTRLIIRIIGSAFGIGIGIFLLTLINRKTQLQQGLKRVFLLKNHLSQKRMKNKVKQ